MDVLWIRLPEGASLPQRSRLARLPLVESTAAGLVEALLTVDPASRRHRLRALLELDPWLLLWAVLRLASGRATGATWARHSQAESSGCETIERVASCLADGLFEQLLRDL